MAPMEVKIGKNKEATFEIFYRFTFSLKPLNVVRHHTLLLFKSKTT